MMMLIQILVTLIMLALFYRFVVKNVWDELRVGNYDPMLLMQTVLVSILLVFTPFTTFYLPLWIKFIGLASFILGCVLLMNGYYELGSSFTGGVTPKQDGQLVTTGYYSLVRHPMYGGGILILAGWSIFWSTWLGLFFSLLTIALFNAKASREETLMMEKYPAYKDYKSRVTKKLIPYLF